MATNALQILVVEENQMQREQCRNILMKAHGRYQIHEAPSLEEGLEIAFSAKPDCILLNQQVGAHHSADFVHKMKSHFGSHLIPVILLTDQPVSADLEHSRTDGVTCVLSREELSDAMLVKCIPITIEKHRLEQRVNQQKHQIAHLALHDELTGLPNRKAFGEMLQQLIARAERHKNLFALLLIDLDRFQIVNDTLGYESGDTLLKEVAQRVRAAVRKDDCVARSGSDEFVVLLCDVSDDLNAGSVAQKVLDTIRKPFVINAQTISVTASIGIVNCGKESNTESALMLNADIALFRAKQEGRNRLHYFSKALYLKHENKIRIEQALGFALEREEFYLVYQPIFDVQTQKIFSVEALLRWHHPEHGDISPLEFIPVAHEAHMMMLIGDWVLKEACEQYAKWQKAGIDKCQLAISINLSSDQLIREEFYRHISSVLTHTHLDPSCLTLEMTEAIAMSEYGFSSEVLQALQALGVRLAIDNFGTGYSSLVRLLQLPISQLKIDRPLIANIETQAGAAIVKSLIHLAEDLNLDVVAEGVETETQLSFLREQGCQLAQGFYFCKPQPADKMTEFLKKS